MDYRGVNLGGWLLLERGPSYPLFESCNSDAHDEYTLCKTLREAGELNKVLDQHRNTFITENDIEKIANIGLNSIRVPFGYWLIIDDDTFYKGYGLYYYIDRLIVWCKKFGIKILLDLHGNPGGESGGCPCGKIDKDWDFYKWDRNSTIDIVKQIAIYYKNEDTIFGIQICNEPDQNIPMELLFVFYNHAIVEFNKLKIEKKIIIPVFTEWRLDEFFLYFKKYTDGSQKYILPEFNLCNYNNIVIDLHYYHCFFNENYDYNTHLSIMDTHKEQIKNIQNTGLQVFIGEWSCAINDTDERTFLNDQLKVYENANGYFFWNWKDGNVGWSLHRMCYEN